MSDETVALTANPSTANIVRDVLRVGGGARVELDKATKAVLRERRDQVENLVEQFDEPAWRRSQMGWQSRCAGQVEIGETVGCRTRPRSSRICFCPMRPDLAGAGAGKLLRNAI
jgi:hypothetical protein